MNKFLLFLCFFLFQKFSYALSGQAYLDRFNQYRFWSDNLPTEPQPEFLNFISTNAQLSTKLRNKWLYKLAKTHNWQLFSQYYQPGNDLTLACDAQIAFFRQNQPEKALAYAKPLWLQSSTQSPACNQLFQMLISHKDFDKSLIVKKIALALENNDISLAQFLLLKSGQSYLVDSKALSAINKHPNNINHLHMGKFNSEFYLYGLKRLVKTNVNQAIALWNLPQTKQMLSLEQQQSFLAQLSIHKAIHNDNDTLVWFEKIKTNNYTDPLLEWLIRYNLKTEKWKKVEQLINFYKNKNNPCWQYWLARAKEAQGHKEAAVTIYQTLAKERNYYGFLASMHLNIAPTFNNEQVVSSVTILKPYQPIMAEITDLLINKQKIQASRLIDDFISELPKDDTSALVYWIDKTLAWHGKSVYLSNQKMLNNQLSLRFPLAYKKIIDNYARIYTLSTAYIYSIIRQESAFREDVTSLAGARGLMQLMPATAKMVAKNEKIKLNDQNQLFNAQKNINLGTAYIYQLTKRFGNHPILIATAYNAGPRQLQYWLKNHPPKVMDLWIETLPWPETRNYLKNVVAFYLVYQYRLQLKPDLKKIMQPL